MGLLDTLLSAALDVATSEKTQSFIDNTKSRAMRNSENYARKQSRNHALSEQQRERYRAAAHDIRQTRIENERAKRDAELEMRYAAWDSPDDK